MKRGVALSLVGILLLAGCSNKVDIKESQNIQSADMTTQYVEEEPEQVELSIWMFPVGNLASQSTLASLTGEFQDKFPNIDLKFEYLDYNTGDSKIEQAIADRNYPDIVFEGPERLVANWGERGLMVDLGDLWENRYALEIVDNVRSACMSNGVYYSYPICMSTHCMGINLEMFEEADALQYIDMENRTWTTDGFIKAVEALYNNGVETVADIYCADKSGDQGTRALVNNLYSGTFTDAAHTEYTVGDEANIKALELLKGLPGIQFNRDKTANDAIADFMAKKTAMIFCWNGALEVKHVLDSIDCDFDILPLAFPTDNGEPNLQGGIWGFGVFDSKDEARINAAKEFIKFFAFDDAQYKNIVIASMYHPVRNIDGIYQNDKLMTEYSVFNKYAGDYYQITPGWTEVRQDWATMLQEIGSGKDVSDAVNAFMEKR